MPLTYLPPKSVKLTAAGALALHRQAPLDGTYGIGIAEALSAGSVDLAVVSRMHRAFVSNAKLVERETSCNQRTEADCADVRSWALMGGEAGASWAETVFSDAVSEGLAVEDPVLELMALMPEDVYGRFAFGAWRFEYGFTPSSAALFVEHYTRVTGNLLELPAAFAEASQAVGNALYRRTAGPDPFLLAKKLIAEGAPELRHAAFRDLEEMRSCVPSLTEAQEWLKIKALPLMAAAKIVWAPFVAYLVLAVEKSEVLVGINGGSLKPPTVNAEKVASYTQYNDAINLYLLYFHPLGKRYNDPSADPKFAGLSEDVFALLNKAYYGHPITPIQARKVLGAARRWTAQHKQAGSLFHVFNAAWAKADWQTILDSVPPNADVYAVFKEFVDANPLPKEGVKLQQTVSDKKFTTGAQEFLTKSNAALVVGAPPGVVWEPAAIPSGPLSASVRAKKVGTPFGVWSKLQKSGVKGSIIHVGFYVPKGFGMNLGMHVLEKSDGTRMAATETVLQQWFADNSVQVTHGHYDMPGTAYTPKVAAPVLPPSAEVLPPPPLEKPATIDTVSVPEPAKPDPIMEFLKETYDENLLKAFVPFDPEMTTTMAKARMLVPSNKTFSHYVFQSISFKAKIAAAFHVKTTLKEDGKATEYDDVILVLQDWDDATYFSDPDDGVRAAIDAEVIAVKLALSVEPAAVAPLQEGSWVRLAGYVNTTHMLDDPDHTRWHYVTAVSASYLAVLPRQLVGTGATVILAVSYSHVLESKPPTSVEEWAGGLDGFGVAGLSAYSLIPPPFAKGSVVQSPNGGKAVVLGAILIPGSPQARLVIRTTNVAPGTWGLQHITAALMVPVEQVVPKEEAPEVPEPKSAPEPFLDDSVPWATPDAASAALKLGYTIRAFADLEVFTARVGAAVTGWVGPVGPVSPVGPVVIVGLCSKPSGEALVIVRSTSFLSFKPASNVVGVNPDMSVIGELLPYGGIGCSATVDYRLTPAVLLAAKAQGVQFTAGPSDPPYFPGTKFAGKTGVLVGWSNGAAVMWDGAYLAEVAAETLKDVVQVSATPSVIDEEEGVVFARGAAHVQLHSDGMLFDDTGYIYGDSGLVTNPPFESGKLRKAAGTVIVLPPGTIITGAKAHFSVGVPSVVLVHPVGGFGSHLTFPKGGTDKGEDLRVAARRETWEETGLIVKLVDVLGDFKRATSMARMYMAEFRGGSPYKAGSETDAVVLRPLKKFDDILVTFKNHGGDIADNTLAAYVNSLPWAKVLAVIDKKILAQAVRWILVNGLPSYAAPASVGAPTHTATDPLDFFGMDPDWQTGTGIGDHYITSAGAALLKALGIKQADLSAKYGPYVSQGAPKPGQVVHITLPEQDGGNLAGTVLGYTGSPAKMLLLANGTVTAILLAKSSMQITTVPVVTTVAIPEQNSPTQVMSLLHVLCNAAPSPVPWAAAGEHMVDIIGPVIKAMKATPATAGAVVALHPFATVTSHAFMYGATVQVPHSNPQVFLCEIVVNGQGVVALFADEQTGEVASIPYSVLGSATVTAPVYTQNTTLAPIDAAILQAAVDWVDLGVPPVGVSVAQIRTTLKSLGLTYAHSLPASKLPFAAWAKLYNHAPILDVMLEKVAMAKTQPAPAASAPVVKATPVATPSHWPQPLVSATLPAPPKAVALPDSAELMLWDSAGRVGAMMLLTGATLTNTSKSLTGGSKPNKVLAGPDGAHYVFKPSIETGGHWRVGAEAAAFSIISVLRPDKTPAVRAITFGGAVGSLQPRVMNAKTLDAGDYGALSDDDIGELLSQHAIDMFLGDHDGGHANWLRESNGQLVVIDKGQTFRFIVAGVQESLDPRTTPAGVLGKALAKRKLSDWSALRCSIAKSSFVKFARYILKVQGLTEVQVDTALGIWEQAVGPSAKGVRAKVRAELISRRDTYVVEWTKVMVKLAQARGESWKWPIPMMGAPAATQPEQVKVDPTVPESVLGFTDTEDEYIATARKADWQGKSLQIDAGSIENQEVLVKSVDYMADGKITEGTLVTFRLTAAASKVIETKLTALATVVTGTSGPQSLAIDDYYLPILAAAKTINHHLVTKKDVNFNAGKIEAYKAVIPALKEAAELTKSGVGKYKGFPTGVVSAMVVAYLDYVNTLEGVLATPQNFVGTTIETFTQFIWEKPTAVEDDDLLKDLMVIKSSAFNMPTSTTSGKRVRVSDVVSVPAVGSHVSQLQISLKSVPGVKLYMAPAGSISDTGLAYYGIVWAILPEPLSASTVARILRVFEKASDVRMSPATPEDKEYLFLQKQAYITTPMVIVVSGVTATQKVLPAPVAAAASAYDQGDKEGAIEKLRPFVAKRLGVSVGDMLKDPRYNAPPSYVRGAGRFRTLRMDYTEASLKALLGEDTYLAHRSTGGSMLALFHKSIPHNGALLANVDRPFLGIPIAGKSAVGDLMGGGAIGAFLCMRSGSKKRTDHLYFDLSLALRTDVYPVGKGDAFGKWTEDRYPDPKDWASRGLHTDTAEVGAGSQNQFVARHDVDWRTYLRYAVFNNAKDRNEAKALCIKHGITAFAGRPLDEVLV